MIAAVMLAAALVADNPFYTAASIVNAASNQSGTLAPNTFVTIYGTNLAYTTRTLTTDDIEGNELPTTLAGTGVRVFVNGIAAQIYYVSPGQINFLIPTTIAPGPGAVQVALDATWGPRIAVNLPAVAPALFQVDAQTAIATHADGSLLTADSPGKPLETIVLYATGLGATVPEPDYAEIPLAAAPLQDMVGFQVLLDGMAVESRRIYYSGVAPGFAGLYQINVQLPDWVGANPQVQLVASGETSPAGIVIPVSISD
jgi:uncharacterized protein (TIGR03437 family)